MILSLRNPKRKLQHVFILALIISFFMPFTNVAADSGPHPIMDFKFKYNIASVSMESAKLMFCDDLDCKISREAIGPFRCSLNSYQLTFHTGLSLHIIGGPMTRQLIGSGSTFEQEIGYSRAVVDGEEKIPPQDLQLARQRLRAVREEL